jgi:Domain of unknown function (DUF222)
VSTDSERARVRSWVDSPLARPAGDPQVRDALGAGFTHDVSGGYRDRGARGFEAGGPADVTAPCSVLAELTGQALEAGVGRLTDDELVGVLRAARRVASWQQAVELAAVAELAERRAAEPSGQGPRPAERVSAEVAAALTLTSRAADTEVALATGLSRLDAVGTALRRGEIDLARASVFVEELAGLDCLQASVLADRHVFGAGGRTTAQLRQLLRRAVLAHDPEAVRRRQRAARQDARVETWQEGSGNGAIAGRELPADRAILADRHIRALARALQHAGMPGTLEQISAEVFLALLTGQSPESLMGTTGQQGDVAYPAAAQPPPAPGPGWSWPAGPLGNLHLTMPLSTWLCLTDNPGEVAGHGALDAWSCRELANALVGQPGTRYCLTITTPDGNPLGHACTRTPLPGAVQPSPSRSGPERAPPRGSPDDTIPAPAAAWVSGLTVHWLETGTCAHPRETKAYAPARLLDHLIKVRNPTCTAPGCRRPAHRCDVDHIVPYDQGGRTCECNTHPACRRHHRLKGSAGWQLEMPEPGILAWRLPHGRTYVTRAEPYPI